MTETISGIIIAFAIIILSRILSKYFPARLFAATILVAIAFIYEGFSLKDNPLSLILLETTVSLIFYFVAMIGYTRNSLLIAYGIFLHGVWDILHHKGLAIETNIPACWPSFCFVVDIIDGLYFLVIFKSQKNSKPVVLE